ncbi:MAG: hypothetical protein IKK61_05480 [Clostridia bacterium]|nr:hypothetical protein [Clostridia bacterium]
MINLPFAQRENIGFQYVLDALKPCSPYGEELVRELKPFEPCQKPELQRQLQNIQRVLTVLEAEAIGSGKKTRPEGPVCDLPEMQAEMERLRAALEQGEGCQKALDKLLLVFMTVKNVRPTAIKCRETALNEIELFELKRFLLKCDEMLPLFGEIQPILQLEGISLKDTSGALDLLDPEHNRVASFYIADGYSQTLRALRKEKRALEEQIRPLPDGEEKEALQAQRSRIAAEEEHEEMRIRGELSEGLRPYIDDMLHNMEAIADIDLTVEKACLALRYGGTMPTFTDSTLDMTDMINPQIADAVAGRGKTFTPVSIGLEKGATVITGANMGGKSVALKTIALNILLIQCGFFPFAKKVKAPLFDGMYIISEDLENIDRGLSSFGGEMVRFNQVVRQMGEGFVFIMLDEFARGTNPDEGAAIVQAVTQYLNDKNAVTVLATHYDNVAQKGSAHYQVIGLKDLDVDALQKEIAARGGDVGVELISQHMNYGLYRVEGKQDCPRDALNICRLLGMTPEILEMVEKNYDR